MRTLALPLVLLLAACGSSNDFGMPESRTVGDCEHGEVQVRAGISDAREGKQVSSDWLQFSVEVANNAHDKDIVVKSIRIDPSTTDSSVYTFEAVGRSFNQTVPENEDHTFDLPTTGKALVRDPTQMRLGTEDRLLFYVTVSLEGGDSYRCQFANRVPRW